MKKNVLNSIFSALLCIVAFTSCDNDEKLIKIKSIELNETVHEMKPDEEFQLVVSVMPEVHDETLTWISSEPAVATVSETGLVIAIADGETAITVVNEDGTIKAECNITVFTPPFPEELIGTWTATKAEVYDGDELYAGYPEFMLNYIKNTYAPKFDGFDDVTLGIHPTNGMSDADHVFLPGEVTKARDENENEIENRYTIILDWSEVPDGKIGNFTSQSHPDIDLYYDGEILYLEKVQSGTSYAFRIYYEVGE